MTPKRHTHKYLLRNYGKRKVYACALPDCSHFQIDPSLVIGKKSLCNQCEEEFILTADLISNKVVRPRCRVCRAVHKRGGPKIRNVKKIKEQNADKAIQELLNKMSIPS